MEIIFYLRYLAVYHIPALVVHTDNEGAIFRAEVASPIPRRFSVQCSPHSGCSPDQRLPVS